MTQRETRFLSTAEVLLIHDDQLRRYGGAAGLMDDGEKLDAALAMPMQRFGGVLLHPDLAAQAGAYLFHLAKGHAFVEGNKRVAAACTNVFLLTNGAKLICTEEQLYALTFGVADGSITKDQAIEFLRSYIGLQ